MLPRKKAIKRYHKMITRLHQMGPKKATASSRLSGSCWTFTRSVRASVTMWKKLKFLFVEHGIKVSGQYYCSILLSEHIWAAKHAMDDNFVFNTTAHECVAISTYYPPLHYREMLSTFAEYHLWFLLISTCCLLRADFFAFIPMKECRADACVCVCRTGWSMKLAAIL